MKTLFGSKSGFPSRSHCTCNTTYGRTMYTVNINKVGLDHLIGDDLVEVRIHSCNLILRLMYLIARISLFIVHYRYWPFGFWRAMDLTIFTSIISRCDSDYLYCLGRIEFRFKFSGMRHCVTGQTVPNILRHYNPLRLWEPLTQHRVVSHNTVKPRFTNASDHEQFGLRTNFPNTKCLRWRTVSRDTNTFELWQWRFCCYRWYCVSRQKHGLGS